MQWDRVKLVIGLLALVSVFAELQAANEVSGPVIGIDLGTTFSCVGIYRNGKVEIIANELGSRITPSYVAFTDAGRLVGEAAKNQAADNFKNTLYDVKRLIGRRCNDPVVQAEKKNVQFDVTCDDSNNPRIPITLNGKVKDYSCEEISAIVLGKMKSIAESYLNKKVNHAVVTVPAYFNDMQRAATKNAGKIAGLDVLRVINEPTAAAIAYGLDKKHKEARILVYDLGGGTLDVSLLNIADGVFEVMATNGDTHLGGEDFDQRVLDHFVKLIEKKINKDLSKNPRAMHRLKLEVERAKIRLSQAHSTKIEIENLLDDYSMDETLTRARFEALNIDLFKKSLKPIDKVLEDAKISKNQIDEIVLVGGSTRIPKVRELLTEYFEGKDLHLDVNPDEAIAYGAAVQGAVLSNETMHDDVVLLDVTPLTLGMEDEDGVMVKIIKRNTVVPTKATQPFTTVEDNQRSVLFRVFQGERSVAKFNQLLGEFNLRVPPAPKGVPEIRVTFELNVDGILEVSAKDVATGNSEKVRITPGNTGRMTQNDIEKAIKDAQEAEEQDREMLSKIEARRELEAYAESARAAITEFKSKLSKEEYKEASTAIMRALKWLKANRDRPANDYEDKKTKLEEIVAPIMTKLYRGNNRRSADMSDDDDFDTRRNTNKGSGKADNRVWSDDEDQHQELNKVPSKSGEYDADLDKVVDEQKKEL